MTLSIIAPRETRLRLACALSLAVLLSPLSVSAQTAAQAGAAPAATAIDSAVIEDHLDPMAQRYRLGHGLRLGDSGLVLGGYATAALAEHAEEDENARLQSLSGFLWWDNGGRWHAFSELELENGLVADGDRATTSHADLQLERLYVDYAASDLFKLRAGKFLTPVGRWNLIHASPLVWTSSRPLITEQTFPTNATGAMVYGTLPWTEEGIEYSVYYSPGEELAREDNIDTFEEALGAHLSWSPLSSLHLGFSYVNFEQRASPDEHRDLFGVDAAWLWHRYELSGEYHYRLSQAGGDDREENGFYIQAVAPLSERLFAVTRYENFQRAGAERDVHIYLGGLNYRLRPALVFKAEFSRATDNDLRVRDGWLGSIAVLF